MIKNIIRIMLPIFIMAFYIVSANAIMPVPKLNLEEYEIATSDKSKVYVEGTISMAKGQQVTVRTANNYASIPIAAIKLGSSGNKEDFQLKIPAAYISQGTNKFYVRSEGLRKVIHPSNMREMVVKISGGSEKKTQTISASDRSVQIGETVSLGAKASSGLPLTYSSSNTNIATVNNSGVITGKKAGACKITITQNGNNEYKSVNKTIVITVNKKSSVVKTSLNKVKISDVKKEYTWVSKVVKPVPKLTYGNKTLKQNVDYTVTYANNKEPGTGKIKIIGKGNYIGTINKTFKISIKDTTKIKRKSGGKDYRVIILSGKKFRLYKQSNASYKNWRFNYDKKSVIKGNGCGPVSIADIMSGYGYTMHAGQVANDATKYAIKMHKKNKKISKSCRGIHAWKRYLKHHGFKAVVHINKKESDATAEKNIRNALNKGHQVFLQVGKGSSKWKKFTGSGFHNIALLGIDKTGKYAYVANSTGSDKQWCKISDLAKGRLKFKNRNYGYIEIWKPLK